MRQQKENRAAEKRERKEKIMTSGGPTMHAEDADVLRMKMKNQKMLTKLNLEKQRD